MKRLTLLRHAKSSWDDTVPRDFDRPVNGRGRRAAARIGDWLADSDLKFDRVIASPAVRVQQTLAAVADAARVKLKPHPEPRIYLASAATLLDVIHDISDACDSVLLVGHNPGLEDLLLLLVPSGGTLRDAAETKYPTATIAVLELDITRWADADDGCARLTDFVRPRDLDPSLGPED